MNKIFSFIASFFSSENYTLKNFAFFLLVIMSIQYIPIETRAGASPVKIAVMAFVPIILLTHFKISKAVSIVFLYFSYIIFTSYFMHPESFRATTVIYMLMFLITFATFYNLLFVERVFSIDEFIHFIKGFMYVLIVLALIHQALRIMGIQEAYLLNMYYLKRNGLGTNSLSYEPSTFARTLGVLYYAYLKCHEFKQGHSVTIKQIFKKEHLYVTLGFGWCMLTMASGTAFICLGVLSLYFMKGAYFVFALPVFITVYSILNYFEVEQFKRATDVVEATTTMDIDEVREIDGSASARIAPLLNTINNLDLGSGDTWFGHGIDYSYTVAKKKGIRMINEIDDYGLVAYGLGLLLVFSCSIDFFSLGTIMYFTGIGGGLGNIAYQWGLLMIFVCIRYFHHNYQIEEEDDDEDDDENKDYENDDQQYY